jgi:hypothetical protein
VGQTFGQRYKQHHKAAFLKDSKDMSRFYVLYPQENSEMKPSSTLRWGFFHQLKHVVAMGFLRSNTETIHRHLIHDTGIFKWTREATEKLTAKAQKATNKSVIDEQLQAIGYFLEHAYDLCIAEKDNVSESPGFEAYGLLFTATNRKKRPGDEQEHDEENET